MKLLITGVPGIGKTTLALKLYDILTKEFNLKVDGFITEEIRERGIRKGFVIKSLDGKVEAILAHVNIKSPYRVSKYGVNVDAIDEVCVPILEQAMLNADVVIIDEIGKMELLSKKFQNAVKKVFDSDKVVIATIGKFRHPFRDSIVRRKDVMIIELTYNNRNYIVNSILESIRKWLLKK